VKLQKYIQINVQENNIIVTMSVSKTSSDMKMILYERKN